MSMARVSRGIIALLFGLLAYAGPASAQGPDKVIYVDGQDDDFGIYDATECAAPEGDGTVQVLDQDELDAYHVDFGFDGTNVKNLRVNFNPTGEVDIRSPCHVTLAGGDDYLNVTADSVHVFGRTGVIVGDDLRNQDGAIRTEGALTIVSSAGGASLVDRVEVDARKISVRADGTAKINRKNTIQAEIVEVISTGDRLDSHALIDDKTFVTAEQLRLEASRDTTIGKDVIIDVGELILMSTGSYATSVALIKRDVMVTAGRISMTSANEATVRDSAQIDVAGEFAMNALTETRCKIADEAIISSGSMVGNCARGMPESAEPLAVAPAMSTGVRAFTLLLMLFAGLYVLRRRSRLPGRYSRSDFRAPRDSSPAAHKEAEGVRVHWKQDVARTLSETARDWPERDERRVWAFAGHELDEAGCELRRAGKQIHVEPLVFDLLVILAERPGALVSKRELRDRLWSDVVVTDACLTRLVCQARRVLGDDGRRQQTIRTIHGRGYQLAVPVRRIELVRPR